MKKIVIFFLLVLVSLSLVSCNIDDAEGSSSMSSETSSETKKTDASQVGGSSSKPSNSGNDNVAPDTPVGDGEKEEAPNTPSGGDSVETPDIHSHIFTEKVATEKYFKSSASCAHGAEYYYSCSCGEKGENSFEYGRALAHTVVDDRCTVCKKEAAQNLSFRQNMNQTYTVIGLGSVGDEDIIVPSKKDGLDVVKIDDMAFENRTHIKRVTLPVTLKNIGMFAFSGCKGITEIEIPANVETLSSTAFSGCSGLESVTVNEQNERYYAEGNCVIERDRKRLVLGIKTSVIPNTENVDTVAENAFLDCDTLTEITIPENIVSIQAQAFGGCTSLKKITLSNSLRLIGNSAFANCRALKEIVFLGTEYEWNAVVKREEWNYNTRNYTLTFQAVD